MLPLTQTLTDAIIKYNAASKLNDFFYHNQDSHDLWRALYKTKEEDICDRFQFVDITNRISKDITKEIHTSFHNKKCIVFDERGETLNGVIQHKMTREYNGKTLTNETSFRYDDTIQSETIALWVETDNKFTSHLYNITQIQLID